MSVRRSLFLTILVITSLGFYLLADWIVDDLRPRYLETMEDSMVDTANLLANILSEEATENGLAVEDLRSAVKHAQSQTLQAKIYEITKTSFDMRIYVVNREGIVVFDSEDGRAEGENYMQWNDVLRTFRGEYGARTTRDNPDNPDSSVLYVAAPIRAEEETVGVVTVAKPSASINQFLHSAKKKIIAAAVLAAMAVVGIGLIITQWVTRPIRSLISYALAVRDGKRPQPPKLGRSDIKALGNAFEEMRDALEGKQYIEHYVQDLTHEMKSPLSALRGAAELLEEEMPTEDRQRFIRNIRNETERLQALVERLLNLAAIEGRKGLRDVKTIQLGELAGEITSSLEPVLAAREIELKIEVPDALQIEGERFLIRQALVNVILNAIEFVSIGGVVKLSVEESGNFVTIRITDNGPGIPDYALERIFERFYSLPRPDTKRKSSGLGLTFVREAITLHGGSVLVRNLEKGGTEVVLSIPGSLDK